MDWSPSLICMISKTFSDQSYFMVTINTEDPAHAIIKVRVENCGELSSPFFNGLALIE